MVLTKAQKGNTHRISSIDGNAALHGRLAAMGLIPGAKIQVIQGSVHGASIVSCKGTQLALGRGLTEHIHLED